MLSGLPQYYCGNVFSWINCKKLSIHSVYLHVVASITHVVGQWLVNEDEPLGSHHSVIKALSICWGKLPIWVVCLPSREAVWRAFVLQFVLAPRYGSLEVCDVHRLCSGFFFLTDIQASQLGCQTDQYSNNPLHEEVYLKSLTTVGERILLFYRKSPPQIMRIVEG